MVLGSIASFVAVVAGIYRLGRLCFGPLVGLLAALLAAEPLLRREPRRAGLPRHLLRGADRVGGRAGGRTARGAARPCFLTLAAAGLLRPDAWVLSGAYWLWCCLAARRDTPGTRGCRYLALAAIAPVLWALVDAMVTGNPLYSLTSTAGPGPGTRTHAGLHERARLGVDLRRAHRQAAGAARRDRRPAAGDLAGAAAGARAAGRAGAAGASCTSRRGPSGRR